MAARKSTKKKSKAKTKKKTSKKAVKPKKVKNKSSSKKPTEVRYHSTKEIKVEKALIDNFIGLQKVMVNMSSKFDELSNQISKLLNIFEVSAKAMAKKEFAMEGDKDVKKVLDKLDNLTQQAGLIGKGLTLIHEVNEERMGRKTPTPVNFKPNPSQIKRPMNKMPMSRPPQQDQRNIHPNQLQPSIMKPQESEMPHAGNPNMQNKKPPMNQNQGMQKKGTNTIEIGENTNLENNQSQQE